MERVLRRVTVRHARESSRDRSRPSSARRPASRDAYLRQLRPVGTPPRPPANGRSRALAPALGAATDEPAKGASLSKVRDTKSGGRRSLSRLRRQRNAADQDASSQGGQRGVSDAPKPSASARGVVGWDQDANVAPEQSAQLADSPLTAQVLSLFSEPGITSITAVSAARALGRPRADVETAIRALAQAGELSPLSEGSTRFTITPERKAQLEAMFREAAHELGETKALALRDPDELAVLEEDEEPRLPVTAGLLSLFLPGTGQLLNGDVGRASLVFAVWSLALLTHLSPIWTFVALYAGAEAFFTAKVRGMERKLALEAAGDKKPTPTT